MEIKQSTSLGTASVKHIKQSISSDISCLPKIGFLKPFLPVRDLHAVFSNIVLEVLALQAMEVSQLLGIIDVDLCGLGCYFQFTLFCLAKKLLGCNLNWCGRLKSNRIMRHFKKTEHTLFLTLSAFFGRRTLLDSGSSFIMINRFLGHEEVGGDSKKKEVKKL